MPSYTNGDLHYQVEEIESPECPVSIITPRNRLLVIQAIQANHAKNAGGIVGGQDAGKWSEQWFDIVTVIESQKILEHNARIEEEIRQSKKK